jgi:hypothetical protein
VALLLLLLPAISRGALGATESSVEADRVQFNASHVVRPTLFYTVHEFTTPDSTTLREFVGADGVVFAVSWQGPLLPDLRTLLGKHFQSLQSADRMRPATHSKLLLESPDLVIHSEGRLRAFSGQAYLPQLLPAGVAVAELR